MYGPRIFFLIFILLNKIWSSQYLHRDCPLPAPRAHVWSPASSAQDRVSPAAVLTGVPPVLRPGAVGAELPDGHPGVGGDVEAEELPVAVGAEAEDAAGGDRLAADGRGGVGAGEVVVLWGKKDFRLKVEGNGFIVFLFLTGCPPGPLTSGGAPGYCLPP